MNVDTQTALAVLAAAVAGLALVFAAGLWRIARGQRQLARRLRSMLAGGSDAPLEQLLERNFERFTSLADRLDGIEASQRQAEEVLTRAVQRVGVVRYNAFPDTGGDQSFALALLDRRGNGIVVSSLHGRSETRIYAKSIVQRSSVSAHTLSGEEAEAIRRAMSEA